jgi:hypothetical protein
MVVVVVAVELIKIRFSSHHKTHKRNKYISLQKQQTMEVLQIQ